MHNKAIGNSVLRRLLVGITVAFGAAIFAFPASALVLPSLTTNTAPANDPGWDNVNVGGSSNGNWVYLGNRWALSARHVGPEPHYTDQTLTFSTGTYNIVPGTSFVLKNPSTYVNTSGQTLPLPFSMSDDTDLRIVRLDSDPGLPELCASAANCAITSTTPAQGSQLTFIGHGRGRLGVTTWSGHNGYDVADAGLANDIKRWGTNNLENPASYRGTDQIFSPSKIPPTSAGVNKVGFLANEVISFVTDYDHSASASSTEVQAVAQDSGSAVFYFDSGTNRWLLAGITNQAGTYSGQPFGLTNAKVVNGNVTVAADLSYYRTIILDTMQSAPSSLVVPGDVNLDGVLSGSMIGGVATGDIAAFVNGWGEDNGTGVGDLSSWQNGDLNRDGKTDIADFVIMRGALDGAGAGGFAEFEAFFGMSTAVPEPSTFVLALFGAGFAAISSRRRRNAAKL